MLDHQPQTQAASAQPVIVLSSRQEAFCQAMARNVGAAEAARRAGYSPKGAKQRGVVLMGQPEIQVRVAQLRADRRAGHQADLEEAAALVRTIMEEALERKSLGLSLRAVELWLKLRGVVQDKRIPHHFLGDKPHPDADLESLDCDPDDEPVAAKVPAGPDSAGKRGRRRNSDLSALPIVTSAASAGLFASTALSSPASAFQAAVPLPAMRGVGAMA
ncbi:terminase small subunit [Skermanella rosea]|uniref:terminase small subunit n=1 Tax=Skermanella rosea TaxID=1817965 RepID=UPI0019324F95|nr:terminase small subunit [Skermanella rosea]UEM05928.1 terminase small subunit [Skermanella rosea]